MPPSESGPPMAEVTLSWDGPYGDGPGLIVLPVAADCPHRHLLDIVQLPAELLRRYEEASEAYWAVQDELRSFMTEGGRGA